MRDSQKLLPDFNMKEFSSFFQSSIKQKGPSKPSIVSFMIISSEPFQDNFVGTDYFRCFNLDLNIKKLFNEKRKSFADGQQVILFTIRFYSLVDL